VNHVCRLSGISERLQAQKHIFGKELDEIKAIHAKRKERASGKHLILKGQFVVSTEEIQKALEEVEKATLSKKKKKKATKEKKRKAPSTSDVSDNEAHLGNEDIVLE
jgi:hypothetical protein